MNKEDYEGASQEFKRWIKFEGKPNDGLIKRRAIEATMFLEGTYE